MAATEEESRRLAEELMNATSALSQFSGMLHGQSEAQLKATKADKDAKEAAAAFTAKMDMAAAAAGALAGAFVNYNKEVYKSGNANKAAAASIESLGEAAKYAGAFLALLVPGGPLVKAAVAGLGLLASELIKSSKLIAEQTDDIYKAYQNMAQAGATGAGGMQDVFNSLQKVGMGTEKFGAYLKLVNENANDLAMFGGSVNKGRKIFENTMASFSTGQRVQMELMGLDREAQSQATMAYLKQQRLLTAGTKAQMDTSSTAVMKYVAETDALTRITGANREEQQKILDEAMAEDMFGQFLDNMRSQGEEGVKKAEQVQNAIIMQQKMYGTQSAKGLRDSLTGFLGTSKENEKFFMSYGEGGQQLVDVLRNVNATNNDMYSAMKAQAKSGKELNESMAGVTGMGVAGDTFVLYKERRLAEQNFNKDLGKLFAEANADRIKQLNDPKTKELAEAMNATVDQQLKLQRGVNMGMDAYITGLSKVSSANATALDVLGNAAYKAAEYLGIIGGGKKVQQSAAVQDATKATAATRDTAKPLQERVDALNKQLDEDEKALKDGKRAGKSVAEMAALEEKILKAKEEHLKAAQELDAQEKVIKEAALKEREIRQKQVAELGKMNRLQTQVDREKEEIASLKEKKYNIEKALANSGKPGGTGLRMGDENARGLIKEYEESIAKKESSVAATSTEIGSLQKKLAPAAAPAGGAAPVAAGAAQSVSSQDDLKNLGLNIKAGDVQAPGAALSPNLIELAKSIQSNVPGFNYFSGFNDKFHQENASSSKHTQGLAADFTLTKPPSKEEGDKISAQLKSLGATFVQNEYANPSSKATAGHFHVEIPKFEDGGKLSGIGLVGEKGPELAVGSANITSNNDVMGVFKDLLEEMSIQTSILREMTTAAKNSSSTAEKMLRYAQN